MATALVFYGVALLAFCLFGAIIEHIIFGRDEDED